MSLRGRRMFNPLGVESVPLWQVRAYLRTMLGDPGVKFTAGELDGRAVWLLRTEAFTAGSRKESRGRPVTIAIDAWPRGCPARKRFPRPLRAARRLGRADAGARGLRVHARETTRRGDAGPEQPRAYSALEQFTRFPALPLSEPAGMKKAVDGIPAFPAWLPRGFALQVGASQTNGNAKSAWSLGVSRVLYPEHHRVARLSAGLRRRLRLRPARSHAEPRDSYRTPGGEDPPHPCRHLGDPFIGDVAPWDRAQWRRHTTDVPLRSGAFAGAVAHC